MTAARSFALAPMSPLIRGMTIALFAIPVLFVAGPWLWKAPAFLSTVGLAVAGLYAWIWLRWRPTRFEVGADGVRVVFPWRSFLVPRSELEGCRALSRETFREEYGRGTRIGVGGLWGGFGRLWTTKGGMLDFYISRTDEFVSIERRRSRPILITPEEPQAMVEAVRSLLDASAA